MKTLNYLLVLGCIALCGCAMIIKHNGDITLTNIMYNGVYCAPGGCRGDIHYLENTEIEIGALYDDYYRPSTNKSNK